MERFVPGGFMLVYAPRTIEEVEVVMTVVRAAAWWVAGREVGCQEKDLKAMLETKAAL